jgi:hypothetical protein
MTEMLVCEGCGTEVKVDHAFGVTVHKEPVTSPSAGRVSIQESNFVVHECAEGTYKHVRSD